MHQGRLVLTTPVAPELLGTGIFIKLPTAGFSEHDPSPMMHNRDLDEGFV
jgi:hypothetical protein